MIRVFIVHEMELINNVIATAIESRSDIEVIGSATGVYQTCQAIEGQDIDVILASIRLPDPGAIPLLKLLREENPDINLIVLGMTETRQQVLHFLEKGASGYITGDSTIEDMIAAIRLAYQAR